MLCKKVSDIWQFLSGNCSSISFQGRGLSKADFPGKEENQIISCIVQTLWPAHLVKKWPSRGNRHERFTQNYNFAIFYWWLKNQNWILISFYCLLLRHYWAWILGGQKKRKMFFFFAFGRTIWTALFFTLFIRRGLTLVLGSKKWKAHQCAILC